MSSTCWVWTIRRSKRLRSSRFHHSRIRLGSVAPSHSLWFQPAHLGKVLPQHLPRTGHFDTLSARLTAPPCQTTCHCYVMSQNVLGSPTGWMISLLRTWITKWCCMLLHATACTACIVSGVFLYVSLRFRSCWLPSHSCHSDLIGSELWAEWLLMTLMYISFEIFENQCGDCQSRCLSHVEAKSKLAAIAPNYSRCQSISRRTLYWM